MNDLMPKKNLFSCTCGEVHGHNELEDVIGVESSVISQYYFPVYERSGFCAITASRIFARVVCNGAMTVAEEAMKAQKRGRKVADHFRPVTRSELEELVIGLVRHEFNLLVDKHVGNHEKAVSKPGDVFAPDPLVEPQKGKVI